MAWGIRLFNDAGKLAFSSENACLQYVGKWSSGPVFDGNTYTYFYRVSFGGVRPGYVPVIFIAANVSTAYLSLYSLRDLGGGSWEASAVAITPDNMMDKYPGVVDFYVFAPAASRTPAAGEYGMRLFDSAGNLTLDTARRLLKISGFGVTSAANGVDNVFNSTPVRPTGLAFGSIPQNWATSAQVIGISYRGLTEVGEHWMMGIGKYHGTAYAFHAVTIRGYVNEALYPDQYWIDGNNYIMFIDTNIYNATTGVF